MKVYVYKQYRDSYAYGEEYIQVFLRAEDAFGQLKQDVENFMEMNWEDIKIDEKTESLEPHFVVFDDGDGNGIYFVIEDKEVIE